MTGLCCKRLLSSVLFCCAGGLNDLAVAADACNGLKANSNVVRISRDKQAYNGSGVLITSDGFVVTVAHSLTGGQAPHPLATFVQIGTGDWQSARVMRIDGLLDLALLKLEKPPSGVEPPRIAEEGESIATTSHPICLSGFGTYVDNQGKSEKGFFSLSATTLGVEIGYLVADKGVDDGYSGGGAFIGGELAGIIVRRKSSAQTFIVPVSYVTDFIAPTGVFVKADRTFHPGAKLSDIPQLIENNRKLNEQNHLEIQKILHSLHWATEFKRLPEGTEVIVFVPQRAFPRQIIAGFLHGKLTAHFDHEGFKRFLGDSKNKMEFAEVAVSVSNKGVIEIADIKEKVAAIRLKYAHAGLPMPNAAKVTKFIVSGEIHIGVDAPQPVAEIHVEIEVK